MTKRILIALGGNALLKKAEKGTANEQLSHINETCKHLIEIINKGYILAVTHGNGPQVGTILLKNELTSKFYPPMSLDICGAESQGMIGYMIQRSMDNIVKQEGKHFPVATIFTQVLVDKNDPAFKKPTKPIGPYYTKKESKELINNRNWKMVEQGKKGFRRVVPSPKPISIIEAEAIKPLVDQEVMVIACGGGGVPVIQHKDGKLEGVEAVIDKDLTAALFAKLISAEILLILTDEEFVSLNFGKPNEEKLRNLKIIDAKKHLKNGQFPIGSMGPKIQSAINFIESGGKKAIITSLEKASIAIEGNSGTVITR